MIVRSTALPLLPQRGVVAQVGFGGQLAPADTFALVGKTGDVPTAVFVVMPPRPVQVGMLSTIYIGTGTHATLAVGLDPSGDNLSISMPGMAPLSLPIGPMQGEYARLDSCAQALEEKWSHAASGDAKPTEEPKLRDVRETSWHVKYPENLLLNRISGLAKLRMTVDEKGRVRDCVAQASIWASRFGEASCDHLREIARFEPARDAQGKPVSALFRTAALFVIYNW